MTKLATLALVILATCLGPAHAAPADGQPVPLFPKLSWGLSEQAALSKGLKTYTRGDTKVDVVGLPSITIGDIDFSAEAVFGKRDIRDVRSGLNYVLLQHEGFVPTQPYNKFLEFITGGFIYAGRGSAMDESAVFYNAIDGNSHLVVTSSDRAKVSLSVAIAPGLSK